MSYQERDGQVILTMSREDYENLLIALGSATAAVLARPAELSNILLLMNRLNYGNPKFTPYQVEQTSGG
jgi:hypothetical protein